MYSIAWLEGFYPNISSDREAQYTAAMEGMQQFYNERENWHERREDFLIVICSRFHHSKRRRAGSRRSRRSQRPPAPDRVRHWTARLYDHRGTYLGAFHLYGPDSDNVATYVKRGRYESSARIRRYEGYLHRLRFSFGEDRAWLGRYRRRERRDQEGSRRARGGSGG